MLSESKARGHLASLNYVPDMVVIATKIGLGSVGFARPRIAVKNNPPSMNQCARARFIFLGSHSILEHSMRHRNKAV